MKTLTEEQWKELYFKDSEYIAGLFKLTTVEIDIRVTNRCERNATWKERHLALGLLVPITTLIANSTRRKKQHVL